jgi:peptidoglycan hydrolase CwlO-like protein
MRYADHDLPVLENKIQNLTGDVIELEWKQKDLNNTITLWNAQLADLGQTITQYPECYRKQEAAADENGQMIGSPVYAHERRPGHQLLH